MHSYTSATLAFKTKCSLSLYHLASSNDQPLCCRCPCCHFPGPRIFSRYFLGLSSPIPFNERFFLVGRRRHAVRDCEMTGLLAQSKERSPYFVESAWKKGIREIEIESNERECRSSRKSEGLSSAYDGGRRKTGGGSRVSYCSNDDIRYDVVEKVREAHKNADSYRDKRSSWKSDVLESKNVQSAKIRDKLKVFRVKNEKEKVDQRRNSAHQMNRRENVSDRGSKNGTRIHEIQSDDELDNVKRASVSAKTKKFVSEESSVSGTWQNTYLNHQKIKHNEQRRFLDKRSRVTNYHYNKVQNDAHPQRDVEETSDRRNVYRAYSEQNLAHLTRDIKSHLDSQSTVQAESRRSGQKLNKVSMPQHSDFEGNSHVDEKIVMEMDSYSNLVQDTSQICRNEVSQIDLQKSVENRFDEMDKKLTMTGNLIQLGEDERKSIQEKTRKNTQMPSKVLDIYSGNEEASSSLVGDKIGKEFRSYSVHSSIPATNDNGTQVEMHEAYYDQFETSRLIANNIVNTSSSWNLPESRMDPQDHGDFLSSNLVSGMGEKKDQARKQAFLLYDSRVESEEDSSALDLTRTSKISNSQDEKLHSLTKKSLVALTLEEEMERYFLIGESSQLASTEITSTWGLNGVRKLPKKNALPNRSGKEINLSAGIQIQNPDRSEVQATLRIENKKETSESTEQIKKRIERHDGFFTGDKSQFQAMQMASSGRLVDASSLIKIQSGVNNHGVRDDISHATDRAIESTKQLIKSSAIHVDQFVSQIPEEIMSPNELRKEGNISGLKADKLTESRNNDNGRNIKDGGHFSSVSGLRGPHDELWDVQGLSSKETSIAKDIEEESPALGAMDLPTPTSTEGTAITRRSPISLWSYVADIIRMSWTLRGHSHSSTLKSDNRASSNESLGNESWFSGHESDEDAGGEEAQNIKRASLFKESAPVKESVEFLYEESNDGAKLSMIEPNASLSSGFNGLAVRNPFFLIEEERMQDSKSSHDAFSAVAIVEPQQDSISDAVLPSFTHIVEPKSKDKIKELNPGFSYPVGLIKTGFSSSIMKETGSEELESAIVGGAYNSSLETFEQTSISVSNSPLLRIANTEGDRPGIFPKLELNPFGENKSEVVGTKEVGVMRRKFGRSKQVLREEFDDWEEAFNRENDQRKIDEFFMREAILEAKKGANAWEVPVGAVLVQNGKIIARGCNMVEELRDSTSHAEMICIREASILLRTWRLSETTLYVTLEPCPMCAGAILQARIDTVVWGTPNRLIGADGSWIRLFPGGDGESSSMNPPSQMTGPVHPFHPNIKIRRGILEKECGDAMQQFFKLRRKKDKKPESSSPSCLPVSNRPTRFFTKLHNIFCMMFCL